MNNSEQWLSYETIAAKFFLHLDKFNELQNFCVADLLFAVFIFLLNEQLMHHDFSVCVLVTVYSVLYC